MNYNQAEAEVRAFFNTAWAAATLIAWPDIKFSIPEAQTWLRFNMTETEGRQVSLGSPGANRFRQWGLITLQIFQPFGQGSSDARTKAATAANIFKGAVTSNGVVFQDVYTRAIGNDGKGFYQINVVISFYYDDIT